MKSFHLFLFAGLILTSCGTQPGTIGTSHDPDIPVQTIQWETKPEQTLESLISTTTYIPLESTPESFLSGISKMIIHKGEVFVADNHNLQYGIRVFGLDGRYKRHIGREGKGPGELLWLGDFTIRGDTLFIADSKAGKIAIYTLDGKFMQDIRISMPDFESCVACDTGFLWTGSIYYQEYPENRFGLYKTDNELQLEWQQQKYLKSSTRALLTEVSDSLVIWMQACSDSLFLYNRQAEPIQCLYFDFPEEAKVPYQKRREIDDMRKDQAFTYYTIANWNPAIVGPYLISTIIQPGGEWDVFMADLRNGAIYTDGQKHTIRNQEAGFYPLNDSTFVSWITPDSEAFVQQTKNAPQLPAPIQKRIDNGDCVLTFYTLKP